MRSRILTVAAALAGALWALPAWSASDSVSSDDGAALTLAPGSAAVMSRAGILDPAFHVNALAHRAVVTDRDGNSVATDLAAPASERGMSLANFLAEPPATTIPFAFSGSGITVSGIVARELAPSQLMLAPEAGVPAAWSLRQANVSAALVSGVQLNLAYGRNLASSVNAFDTRANPYDGLFFSGAGVRSLYAPAAGSGNYAGLSVDLTDALRLRVGHASTTASTAAEPDIGLSLLPRDLALRLDSQGQSAQTTAAGVDWNFAQWGSLGVTASHTTEDGALLGDAAAGAVTVVNSAETAALGISARVGFGAGWVTTVSYSEGVTQLDLRPNGLLSGTDTMRSRAYGIAIAKEGLFGNDVLGVSVSRPLLPYSGLGDPGASGRLLSTGATPSLLSGTPESDIELGYVTTFLGGSLALQANAAYQINANGQEGQDAAAVAARAKLKF